MLLGGEVGDERQVGDLHARPSELEDAHEDAVVGELRPLIQVFAPEAVAVDEGEAHDDQHRACGRGVWFR